MCGAGCRYGLGLVRVSEWGGVNVSGGAVERWTDLSGLFGTGMEGA